LHAEVILLLVQQAYGYPAPAAHERPWRFWFDLATLGLTSTLYRSPVPLALKAKAMDKLLAVALDQNDIDIVHEIITTLDGRKDPYLTWITIKLREHAEGLQRAPQSIEGDGPRKRRRLDVLPEPRGDTRGRARRRNTTKAACRSGSRTQRSPVWVTASTSEQPQRDQLPTPFTPNDSERPREPPQASTVAAKELSQALLSPLLEPALEHNNSPLQQQNFNETLANSTEPNDPATSPSRTNDEEDALAEGEYFIQEIKSHRYLDLVKWRGRSEQHADWIPRGSILRKGKLHAQKILDSKLELEIQYEGYPGDETIWEAERMLRCPNLEGPNLLEQYKEKHKLGVYADSD
jgi:hypothetical protein